MPVRFKGTSEYQKHYDWKDSYKNATFSPSKEQLAATAGIDSASKGISLEPAIQRKKKPFQSTRTSTTHFIQEESVKPDEYMLLGGNQKFDPSIKYRNPKATFVMPKKSKSATYHVKEFEQTSGNPHRKHVPTAPKVDTSKYKPPVPLAPRSPDERKGIPRDKGPREGDIAVLRKAMTAQPSTSAPAVTAQTDLKKAQVNLVPKPQPDKQSGGMNEFVQTNLDQGIADSGQEAPDNYAMKYRAGIPPPRSDKKRKTEYQKEFSWKNAIDPAPVISAEEMVYGHNQALGPGKSDPVPKTTEYGQQFKPWHLYAKPTQDDTNRKAKLKRSKSAVELPSRTEEEKQLLKEAQNPLKLHMPHGKYRKWKSEYKSNFKSPSKFKYEDGSWKGAAPPHVQPQENGSDNSQVLPVSNWYAEVLELRKKADEYRKRSHGTHFSREHMAQLLARQADLWDEVSSTASLSALSLESATHTRQMLRDKEVQVDIESDGTSENKSNTQRNNNHATMNRAAQSNPTKLESVGREQMNAISHQTSKDQPVNRRLAWTESDSASASSRPSRASTITSGSLSDEDTLVEDDDDGRIPTPELKKTSETRRHHLDVTTPATGGAILTSPQPRRTRMGKAKKSGLHHEINKSRPDIRPEPQAKPNRGLVTRSEPAPQPARLSKPSHVPGGLTSKRYTTESTESLASETTPIADTGLPRQKPKLFQTAQPTRKQSSVSCRQGNVSPTYGMPTQDTHVLLDDEVTYDKPMKTEFVHSPISKADKKSGAVRDRPNSGNLYGRPMSAIPQARQLNPRGGLNAIDERMGQTYLTPPKKGLTREDLERFSPPNADDDALSTSMQSLASSSSLASYTLERARNRRDEFWGKGGEAQR